MPILTRWNLDIDADAVLRGQGADPERLRERKSRLITIAERALAEGAPLIEPQVLFKQFKVESLQHERLRLDGGRFLNGSLIAQHLVLAERVIVMVCTIGAALEAHTSKMASQDLIRSLALYGVGSAAVEALANAACRRFEDEARADGMEVSIPLSPGMIGWTVGEGQPQIFGLIDAEQIGVTLTTTDMMVPHKSLSMVIGVGSQISQGGRTCDYCTMRETCRYQDHYDQ